MVSIRPLPEFTAWHDRLSDRTVRGIGVSELRIHVGAGWRVYFAQCGALVIVFLAGGAKRTQKSDIKRAKALAALLDCEGFRDEQTS